MHYTFWAPSHCDTRLQRCKRIFRVDDPFIDGEPDARMTTSWLVSVFDHEPGQFGLPACQGHFLSAHSSMPGPLRISQMMLNGAQNKATDSHIKVATATVTNSKEFPALIEQIDNSKASASPETLMMWMLAMKYYDESMLYHALIE
ncbi:hypothetical protein BELL_0054g00120 [Botrytis elliptica]|uniref:Uncharacterized protein n=1 Tax=Botrytis elliptica TaxID=278938 RepID=A0A4Z1K001_9HELO|nr:hypothetical protein BELL_0054g00120 [Botrytis elliptica]